MKTSNCILTAFLIFFFGGILALNIDSKLYEPDYKRMTSIKERKSKALKKFYTAYNLSKSDFGSKERWLKFVDEAKAYHSEYGLVNTSFANNWTWHIVDNYKKHNDTSAFDFGKKWCKIAHEISPKDYRLCDTYAAFLYEIKEYEQALKLQEYAVKESFENDEIYHKWYVERLNRYKKAILKKAKNVNSN